MLSAPLLTGDQTYLKKLQQKDITAAYVQWLNDSSINQFLESRHQMHTITSCQNLISNLSSQEDNYFWGIYCKQSNKHIGNIKLGPINTLYQRASIGLLIGDTAYWQKGIATEVIQLVSNFAFQGLALHKLDAGCYASNKGSKKAFIKAGFQIEGVIKDHFTYQDKFEDCILLGKVSEISNKDEQ